MKHIKKRIKACRLTNKHTLKIKLFKLISFLFCTKLLKCKKINF